MSTAHKMPFELVGADGGPLRGEVRMGGDGTGRPPVVICHGFKGCKDWGFFPAVGRRMAKAGMTAVTFNFSGSGVDAGGAAFTERERFAASTFSNDVRDIGIVCDALLEGSLVEGLAKPTSYALFGYSRGGGAAVLHASARSAVRCLVTWAAISHTDRWDEETKQRWREEGRRSVSGAGLEQGLFFNTDMLDDIEQNVDALDVKRAAARVTAPWLIIHGEADDFVTVSEGLELHGAADETRSELYLIPGANHLFGPSDGTNGDTRHFESAVDRTLDWLARFLF